jgi:PKD repeat protein
LWHFGDGETSIATNPLHIYDNGGTYTVTLEATNDCGTDVYTATVVLNSAPIADFIADPTTGCAPLTVEFTSTSLGVVTSYNWSFPGGSPSSSNQPMPTVTYNSPGSFDVRLIVGNAIGFDTLLLEDFIVVTNDVTSNFTADVDGSTVDLLNNSSGATEFLWLIDGSSFTSEDLTYTFDDDGDFLVQLIASGECGSDTSSQVIHISTEPIAGFASNVVSGCQPLTVEFINTSSTNVTAFAWVFEGGTPSTSSEESPVVVYNQPGIYDVQLTVWSAGGMDVLLITEMIEVSPQPVASFTTVQSGLDLEFINNSQFANEYFWEFGDGNFSTEMNPTHTYADFGTYTIELVVENSCGTDTMSVQLQLSGAPVPVFTANQTHGCVPMEVQFIDMSQNSPEFWEWSFPGGTPDTSNLQNPLIVYSEPGIYPVTLRVSNAGGAQSMVSDAFIHVATPPTAGFAPAPNDEIVSFVNQSQDATTYIWQFGDGSIDTATNPVHVYSVSGTYEVMLIAMNACASDTMTQQVTVTVTGLKDIGEGISIEVYPNPNVGDFTVRLENAKESYELEVLDLVGRRVMFETLEPTASGTHKFSLNPGAQGLYTVVIQRKEFRHVVKMVVL